MKINPRHNSANALLVCVVLVCVAGIAYLGYKMIQRLQRIHYDPTHGNTNLIDSAIGSLAPIIEQDPQATIFIPSLNVRLPLTNLAYTWSYAIETSSNLHDWENVEMEWDEVLANIQTNHAEAQRFYRRVVWW